MLIEPTCIGLGSRASILGMCDSVTGSICICPNSDSETFTPSTSKNPLTVVLPNDGKAGAIMIFEDPICCEIARISALTLPLRVESTFLNIKRPRSFSEAAHTFAAATSGRSDLLSVLITATSQSAGAFELITRTVFNPSCGYMPLLSMAPVRSSAIIPNCFGHIHLYSEYLDVG